MEKNHNFEITSLKERYDLFDEQDNICDSAWPEFMMQDPIGNKNWMDYIDGYKDHQLLIMEGDEILAILNTIPLEYKGELEDLPDDGWDWAMEKGVNDLKNGCKPNTLVGVQVVINPKHQGKGLSAIAVMEMAKLAKKQGYERLVIPVRPAIKHKYPLIPMEEYIKWENKDGYPFDNWLRVHVKAGGKIIKVCPTAMYIPGTTKEWEEWTGVNFPGSGEYIIPGALNPISVDTEKDLGVYIEPNVWVLHKPK